jgi:hypothetical protein
VALDLEANPVEIKSEAVQEEDPKEKAAVKTVRPLKKQHGDRHLAASHCSQPKKRPRAMADLKRSWLLPAEGRPNPPCRSGTA